MLRNFISLANHFGKCNILKDHLKIFSSNLSPIHRDVHFTSENAKILLKSLINTSPTKYKNFYFDENDKPGEIIQGIAVNVAQTFYRHSIENLPNNSDLKNKLTIQLKDLSDDQLIQSLTLLTRKNQLSNILTASQLQIYINVLDLECCYRTNTWSVDRILYILDIWHQLKANKLMTCKFYQKVCHEVFSRKCSVHNLIQIIYYVGHARDKKQTWLAKIERRLIPHLKELNILEIGIVCHAFFKCKVTFKSRKLLQYVSYILSLGISRPDMNSYNAINILKQLRLNNFHDDPLIKAVKDYILNNDQLLNSVEIVHFIAFFANLKIYDNKVFDVMQNRFLEKLFNEKVLLQAQVNDSDKKLFSTMHPALRSRVKDIARFLWAMALPEHKFNDNDLDLIEETIKERHRLGEFEKNSDVLIDCLISLSMYERYPLELINYLFSPKLAKEISSGYKSKPVLRLRQLQGSIDIDFPLYGGNRLPAVIANTSNRHKQIDIGPAMRMMCQILDRLQEDDYFYKCHFNLPHIRICGIEIFEKKNMFLTDNSKAIKSQSIEIHEEPYTLTNSRKPTCIFSTKVRQLKKLGHKVTVLSHFECHQISILDAGMQLEMLRQIIKNT